MTSNKSQGHEYEVVGVNLTQDFFAHGQLYVALSRVTNPDGLKIFKPKSKKEGEENYMQNIVYKEILSKPTNVEVAKRDQSIPGVPEDFDFDDTLDFYGFENDPLNLPPKEDTTRVPLGIRDTTFNSDESRSEKQDLDYVLENPM